MPFSNRCIYCVMGRNRDWTKERLALLRTQMSNMIYAAQAAILFTTLMALVVYPFASLSLNLFFGLSNLLLNLPPNATVNASTYSAFADFGNALGPNLSGMLQTIVYLILATLLLLVPLGVWYWNKNKEALALVEHLSHLEGPIPSSPQSPSAPRP